MNQQYIFKLIKENSRIIIPNFGAFLLKEKHSSESNEVLSISFNDFLKFNDGVLVDHIAQKEKVNKVEAELQISDFVNQIKSEIDEKGKFIIENIGELYKDDNNKIKLRQQGEADSLVNDIPKEEPTVRKIKPAVQKPIIEKEEKPKHIVTKPPIKKPTTPRIEKAVSETPVDYTLYEKKSRKGLWLSIIIILAVVATAAIYFSDFFDSSPKNDVVENNSIVQQDNLQPVEEDIIKPDESVVISDSSELKRDTIETLSMADSSASVAIQDEEVQEPEQIEEEVEEYSFEGKYYHLIAASYPNLKAAQKFVDELNEKGFHSRVINKKNGHYRVSYDSFVTKAEALENLKEISANTNKNAWYLYHKLD